MENVRNSKKLLLTKQQAIALEKILENLSLKEFLSILIDYKNGNYLVAHLIPKEFEHFSVNKFENIVKYGYLIEELFLDIGDLVCRIKDHKQIYVVDKINESALTGGYIVMVKKFTDSKYVGSTRQWTLRKATKAEIEIFKIKNIFMIQ
jgi:hypothetical protein